MQRAEIKKLKYEDFPVRLFFYLLSKEDALACRFLGEHKWQGLKTRWEQNDTSLASSRLLEDQKRTILPLIKAQKGTLALRWLGATLVDPKELFLEIGLPWDDDKGKLIDALQKYIQKNTSQYENNLIQLKANQEDSESNKAKLSAEEFTIDDAIATLNLAGFSIPNPDKLTIGQYKAMNKAIKDGRRRQS